MSKKITDAPKNLKHTSMRLLQLLFQQKKPLRTDFDFCSLLRDTYDNRTITVGSRIG